MRSSSTNEMNCMAGAGRGSHFFFRVLLLFAVLLFCMYQYSIHRIYGFSLYPDEFGYWASAAQWLGYDWSDAASLGSYYSFGYSLILAPILYLCKDSVIAYRMAVTVNMLLHCAAIVLLWKIYGRIYLPTEEAGRNKYGKEKHILLATGTAVFYPVWGFYTQMTMAEALLAFLYVFICYQFILLFEKPKMIRVMLLSLSFLYLYFIHMRTVGVALSGIVVLVLFIWHAPQTRKLLLPGMIILILGAGMGLYMKGLISATVYASADAKRLAVNDYAGQIGKLKSLCNREGIVSFLSSCAGKLYYMGMATFGLFYPAVFACMKQTGRLIKDICSKPSLRIADRRWLYPFLLFSVMGQFFVSAVFMNNSGRADGIVYGRYNDYLLPVLIGIGILTLLRNGCLLRSFFYSVGISTGLFAIVLWRSLQKEPTLMYGFHAAALNYLPDSTHPYQFLPEFSKAYFLGIVLMAIMTGCIAFCRNGKQGSLCQGIVLPVSIALLVEILLTGCLSKKYTWYFNDIDYQDLRIYEYMSEWQDMHGYRYGDMPVSYLYGGGGQYIDLLQFAMRDRKIAILQEQDSEGEKMEWDILEATLPKAGFLIADYESAYLEKLGEKYDKCRESASFVLYITRGYEE